jgi:hypothetical protein
MSRAIVVSQGQATVEENFSCSEQGADPITSHCHIAEESLFVAIVSTAVDPEMKVR